MLSSPRTVGMGAVLRSLTLGLGDLWRQAWRFRACITTTMLHITIPAAAVQALKVGAGWWWWR